MVYRKQSSGSRSGFKIGLFLTNAGGKDLVIGDAPIDRLLLEMGLSPTIFVSWKAFRGRQAHFERQGENRWVRRIIDR
jgi:hypothetical protein